MFDRYALKPGANVMGPALIEENESTCVIGAGDRVVRPAGPQASDGEPGHRGGLQPAA